MKLTHHPVATAVALALITAYSPARADDTANTGDKTNPPQSDAITVTGIRASKQKSLNVKRNADVVEEVVSAEDVGKMPDKNVADALQRLPGVNISSAAGGEGGFDENDRVSIRGTSPSLTQTLINGHPVGSGDWFILDQIVAVGRSVSYSLLPSELVSRVEVYNSSEADRPEGGVAGDVNIETFKPIEGFNKQVTAQTSFGAVHSSLAGKTDPQFSGMVNWKNEANTIGILGQAFYEERHLRRDGNEIYTLGGSTIQATDPIGVAHPNLVGVSYPDLIGSTLFEQERKRKGGLLDIEIKPEAGLTLDLNGFYSHMDAANYNRNFMGYPQSLTGNSPYALNLPGNPNYQSPWVDFGNNYKVVNGTLVYASFPAQGTAAAPVVYGLVDQIYRPESNSQTSYIDLDAKYKVSERLSFSGQVGFTKGQGSTPQDDDYEAAIVNSGLTYQLNGLGGTASVSFPNTNPANYNQNTMFGSTWGSYPASTVDQESYGQGDGEYLFEDSILNSVKFGLRYNDHKRSTLQVGSSTVGTIYSNGSNVPAWGGQTYPSNFGSGLPGSGGLLSNVWQLPGSAVQAWTQTNQTHDATANAIYSSDYTVEEKDSAAYAMVKFGAGDWSGNAGVRFVQTKEAVASYQSIPSATDANGNPIAGALTSSAGSFLPIQVNNTYNDILPSANFKYSVTKDVILRAAASRTMTRPDYSALGGAVNLDDTSHTGSGGNPYMRPITSNNFDLDGEWYYAPKALLSLGLFYMDMNSYVTYGTAAEQFRNLSKTVTDASGNKTHPLETYLVSAPLNGSARVDGFELALEQPIGAGFGISANYTFADAKETDANCGPQLATGCDVVGASKNTYNVSAYFENDRFNAHIAYTYRSHYLTGLYNASPAYQDDQVDVAAAVGYTIDKHFAVTLDGLNLNNPIEKSYAANKSQPSSFYVNGRQYYLNLTYKY